MATAEIKKFIDKVKSKLQFFITTFLLLIILGYLVSFIPLDKLGIPEKGNIWELLYKLATSVVLSLLLRKPLFGTDPLASGKSKECEFFRSFYPSILIQEKYGVVRGSADKLWFDYFNTWSKEDSNYYSHWRTVYYSHWRTVFERTYMCRLIFYLSRLQMIFLILSISTLIVMLAVNYYVKHFFSITPFSIGYIVVVIFIYLLLKISNKIPRKDGDEPTGCWYKYREISNIEKAILTDEILNKAQTYDEALELINNIE